MASDFGLGFVNSERLVLREGIGVGKPTNLIFLLLGGVVLGIIPRKNLYTLEESKMKRIYRILLSVSLPFAEFTVAQNVEIEVPNASTRFWFGPNGTEPAFYSVNNWGLAGRETNRLYQVHAAWIYQQGSLVTSDERLKENISDLGAVTDKLKKVKTVKYDMKAESDEIDEPKKKARMEEWRRDKIGFLAQNLKENFPEVVEQSTETGTMYVNYDAMVPVLLKAIVELQGRIETLEKSAKKQPE